MAQKIAFQFDDKLDDQLTSVIRRTVFKNKIVNVRS